MAANESVCGNPRGTRLVQSSQSILNELSPMPASTQSSGSLIEDSNSSVPASNSPFKGISHIQGIYLSQLFLNNKTNLVFFLLGHEEFIQMLVNAKAVADMNEGPVRVQWRGYHTSVKPHLPPFTKDSLKMKLAEALQCISLPTPEEREVLIYIFFNSYKVINFFFIFPSSIIRTN